MAGTVALPCIVEAIALNPSGTRLYVANGYPANAVSVIDTATLKVVANVGVGVMPMGVAVNPAGTRVYVANVDSNTVSVIDTASNNDVATIPIWRTPRHFAVHPSGAWVYVSGQTSNSVSVIDTSTNTVVATVAVGEAPYGIAVNAAGTRVYVVNSSSNANSVSVIDTATNTVMATVVVGLGPEGVGVNPSGTRVYVANRVSNSVSVIDATTNSVIATIKVGSGPQGVGVSFGSGVAAASPVVEFYHAALDHYFITWMPNEIAILDAGTQIRGWTRTGYSFKTYTTPQAGTSPVCRYYIPPGLGDSHFFGRGTVECNATGQKNPTFVLEDPAFMQMYLPAAGVCPANTTQVYRVFSNRLDANHRYMTDRTVRDQMVAKGWLAEGDGPDLVVMCAPQ